MTDPTVLLFPPLQGSHSALRLHTTLVLPVSDVCLGNEGEPVVSMDGSAITQRRRTGYRKGMRES